MAHTPGSAALAAPPWTTDPRYPGKVYSDDSTGSIVAECGGFRFAQRSPEQIQAHATLIAAAPDLLEACRAMLIWDASFDGEDCEGLGMRIDQLRAAVAKAEGR